MNVTPPDPHQPPGPGGTPPPKAPVPPTRKRTLRKVATAGALVLFGIVIGSAGGEDTKEVPGPERVRTVTAPAKTVTETVERTPAVCVEALRLAEQGLTLSAESMAVVSTAFTAITEGDSAGLDAASTDLERKNRQIVEITPDYREASRQCRSGR